ncbi:MAG: RidA family protein [Desulfobacterales bacterium]|jgi:enamine deaminase RidA (YjgF/YER057c/UK114 family)
MQVEARLKELGIDLPPAITPVANYVPAAKTGNLIFLSGHGPVKEDGTLIPGKVGADLTTEQGYETARRIAIGLLGTLKTEIGDLDAIRRIVKLLGFVNCTAEFADQPKVINGASDLLVEVFGEKGKHARSAVGTNALPFNIAVEIEMIVEIKE